jgi:hypothetical protein
MDNRFNELPPFQQKLVSQLINALASNQHVRAVTLDRIVDGAAVAVQEEGRHAMPPGVAR